MEPIALVALTVLAFRAQGDGVSNLHAFLDRMGFGGHIAPEERERALYGATTLEAVRAFQQEFGIAAPAPGEISPEVAAQMNEIALRREVFFLCAGAAIGADGAPAPEVALELGDVDNPVACARVRSDANGRYRAFYDPRFYAREGALVRRPKDRPDLVLRALGPDGAERARSETVRGDRPEIAIDLRLPAEGGPEQPQDAPYSVSGAVVGADGLPVPGVTVVAWDRDVGRAREQLGRREPPVVTDAEGRFAIAYGPSAFREGEGRGDAAQRADMLFTLTQGERPVESFSIVRLPVQGDPSIADELPVGVDEMALGLVARPDERVRIVLDDVRAPRGPSLFERLTEALAPLTTRLPLADFDEAANSDVRFAARECGLERADVADMADAHRLAREVERRPEHAFAVVRLLSARDARAVAAQTPAALARAFTDAGADGLIPPTPEADIEDAAARMRDAAARRAMALPLDSGASFDASLRDAIPDPAVRADLFARAASGGLDDEAWARFAADRPGLDVAGARFALQTAALAGGAPGLAERLRAAAPGATTLRTLALELDERALADAVSLARPAPRTGEDAEAAAQRRAAEIAGLLAVTQTTAVVARDVAAVARDAPGLMPQATADALARAVRATPFDLARDRVADLVNAHADTLFEGVNDPAARAEAVAGLARVQRLFRVSPDPVTLKTALSMRGADGGPFRGALDIARLSEDAFVARAVGATPEQVSGLRALHQRAAGQAETVSTLVVGYHQERHDATPALAVPGRPLGAEASPVAPAEPAAQGAPGDPKPDAVASLQDLLGGAEMCECDDCRSVMGPAAYLVDLFEFLDKRCSPDAAGVTPLDVLIGNVDKQAPGRRPDLAHIKLSCENTNTTIPTIDLINEILESIVAQDKPPSGFDLAGKPLESSYGVTGPQLSAAPENVQDKAYEIVSAAVYPMSLPFDRLLATARAAVALGGVDRAALLELFDARGAAATALQAERLGLFARDVEILTGMRLDGTPGPTPIQTAALFGREGADWMKDLPKVRTLLDALDITYTELVALLRTRVVGGEVPDPDARDVRARIYLTVDQLRTVRQPGYQEGSDAKITEAMALGQVSLADVTDLLEARKNRLDRIWVLDPPLGCDLDLLEVRTLDGGRLDGSDPGTRARTEADWRRINGFVRLARRMGATFDELDAALEAVGPHGDEAFSLPHLEALGALAELRRLCDVNWHVAAALAGGIGASGRTSLYARLFLATGIARLHPAFGLDADGAPLTGNSSLETGVPGIAAALALEPASVRELARSMNLPTLTLEAVSALHRVTTMAGLLGLPALDLVSLAQALGGPDLAAPVAPSALLAFMRRARLVLDAVPDVDAIRTFVSDAPDAWKPAAVSDAIARALVSANDADAAERADETTAPAQGESDLDEATRVSRAEARQEELEIRENARLRRRRGAALAAATSAIGGSAATVAALLGAADDPAKALLKVGGRPALDVIAAGEDASGELLAAWRAVQISAALGWDDATTALAMGDMGLLTQARLGGGAAVRAMALGEIAVAQMCIKATGRPTALAGAAAALVKAAGAIDATAAAAVGRWLSTPAAAVSDAGAAAFGALEPDQAAARPFAALALLKARIEAAHKLGLTCAQCAAVAVEPVPAAALDIVLQGLKSRFSASGWLDASRRIFDPIREASRDALVAYLVRKKELRDADQLFGLYFIDMQTNAFVLTSRIRQAIFAVQIFVQRCLMGLEIKNGVAPSQINAKEWRITGRYPTWASLVQALLFPEHLLEPGWRDDKTPAFMAFENALRQSDATAATAERGYSDLLESVCGVASLEVCGTFLQTVFEGDEMGAFTSVLHVVGRSRGGVPRKYYYRRLNRYEHHQEWTAWSQINADVQGVERDRLSPRAGDGSNGSLFEAGVHVLPVMHEGRLHLFWPTLVRKVDQPEPASIDPQKKITPRFASPYWEVKLCWSQLQGETWTPKQQSSALYESWWNDTGVSISGGPRGAGGLLAGLSPGQLVAVFARDEPQFPNPADLVLKATGTGDAASIVLGLRRPRSAGRAQRVEALARFSLPTRSREMVARSQGGFVDGDHVALSAASLSGSYMGLSASGAVKATPPGQTREGDRLFDAPADTRIVTLNQGFGAPLQAPLFLNASGRSYIAFPSVGTTTIAADAPKTPKDHLPWTTAVTSGVDRAALLAVQPPETAPTHPWAATATAAMRLSSAAVIQTALAPKDDGAAFAAPAIRPQVSIARAAAVSPSFLDGVAQLGRRTMSVDAVNLTVEPFWHAHAEDFAKAFRTGGLDALLAPETQLRSLGAPASFMAAFGADPNRLTGPTDEGVAFEASSAYGVYNWELFFHAPMLLMKRLWENGRLDEALEWFHRVLNPLDYGDDVANAWRFTPLRHVDMTPIDELLASLSRPDGDPQKTAMLAQIQVLRLFPFRAHRLARLRPGAYRRWAAMQYILLRVAIGDRFLRRFTPEDVNASIQHFVIAHACAGSRPQTVTARTTLPAMSYAELRPRLNAFGNVAYEAETLLGPAAGATPAATTDAALGVVRRASIQYFGVPRNQKLLALWDLVEDRLYKVRNGMNIDGQQIQLPLFSPPIDPALLAEAAAAGLDIADVAAALTAPPPRRRFRAVHREAVALAEAVARLGSALSESRDRRDAEELAYKRAQNEKDLADLILQTRQAQVDEAARAVESARAERLAPLERWRHYRDLLGADLAEPTLAPKPEEAGKAERYTLQRTLNLVQAKDVKVGSLSVLSVAPLLLGAAFGGPAAAAAMGATGVGGSTTVSGAGIISGGTILSEEAGEIEESFKAADKAAEASNIEILGSVLQIIPSIEAAVKPLGGGVAVHFGGQQLAGLQSALSREKQAIGAMHSFFAGLLGKQASYVLREREWAAQLHQAAADVKRAEHAAAVAVLRKGVAERELAVQQDAVLYADQVKTYLEQKHSNVELFDYRIERQMELFRRCFDLALERALMAQASFGYEREPRAFVRVSRPADARGELMSGHELLACLADMERAYVEPPELAEITRQISLRQIAPQALWTLRETGEARFTIPEALFDIDYPGHYDRRLRSVQVTIPYLQTPGAPLTGELVLEEAFRRKVAPAANMPDIAPDGVTQAPWIALSTVREDGGHFELSGQSDDYLPFEGRGAVSRWTLRMPKTFRRVNYRAISDVAMTFRYVAKPGGAVARDAVEKRLGALYATVQSLATAPAGAPCVLLSLKHDLPDVWDAFQKAAGAPIRLDTLDQSLPYLFRRSMKTKLVEAHFSEMLKDGSPAQDWRPIPNGQATFTPQAAANDLDDVAVLALFSARRS
jgi:hypothetical protein